MLQNQHSFWFLTQNLSFFHTKGHRRYILSHPSVTKVKGDVEIVLAFVFETNMCKNIDFIVLTKKLILFQMYHHATCSATSAHQGCFSQHVTGSPTKISAPWMKNFDTPALVPTHTFSHESVPQEKFLSLWLAPTLAVLDLSLVRW